MKRTTSLFLFLLLSVLAFAQTNQTGAGMMSKTPTIKAPSSTTSKEAMRMPMMEIALDDPSLSEMTLFIKGFDPETSEKQTQENMNKAPMMPTASSTTYTITVTSHNSYGYTAHGSDMIRNTSKQYTVTEGSTFSVTAYPDNGYRVAYIRTQKSGFLGQRADYTDNTSAIHSASISDIKENATIDVYFEKIPTTKPTYTVTVNSHGYNGYTKYNYDYIRNSSKQYVVQEGSSFYVSACPDNEYRVDKIRWQQSGFIAYVSTYTDDTPMTHGAWLSDIKENATIDVYFERIPSTKPYYTITVNSHGTNGYAKYNSDVIRNTSKQYSAVEGSTFTISACPDNGYRVAYIRQQQSGYIAVRADYMDNASMTHSSSISGIKENGTFDVYYEKLPTQYITFADSRVKNICLTHWDTNGDNEIDMNEAAAVTSLGTVFKKSQITSFNELQYFTGLTKISDEAFSNSTIQQVTLPVNITALGKDAFLYCKSLTSINIPAKVQTIAQNALSGCSAMTTINVDVSNSYFCSVDGVLFNKDKTLLVQFPSSNTTAYTVPMGTRKIGRDAFFDSKVQSLVLPETLRELDYDAFGYSKALTELVIPEGVTTIGDYILDGCTGLKKIEIPASVKTMGAYAFNRCSNMNYVNIMDIAAWCAISFANEMANPLYYAHNLYLSDEKVTDMVIPNSVNSIGKYAFYNCTSLKSADIPNSVNGIASYAFYGCSNLTSVTIDRTTPLTIDSYTFSNRKNATLYVPYGAKTAYRNANYWKEFKQIVEFDNSDIISFADAQTKALCVGKWDTNGDGELSVMEAAAVTSLGTTFKKAQITSFNELRYFTGLTSISEEAFSNSTIKQVTLPETVTSLEKDAFLYCKSLTSIGIPASLNAIGQNALSGCSKMTSITVDDNNSVFCSQDGILFSKDKKELLQFPAAKATAYTVPWGTVKIGRDAFYFSKLKSLTLPSTLRVLDYDAFGYSQELTELVIPEGVTTVGEYIVDGCTALKRIDIPTTVTSIGANAFRRCNSLNYVNIGDIAAWCNISFANDLANPLMIAHNLYLDEELLTDLVIPNSVTKLDKYAFYNCTSLASVEIPSSVTSIGSDAFNGCSNLTKVTTDISSPLAISQNTFSNRKNATLYVPTGCKAAYAAAAYWKEFKQILTSTDSYAVVSPDGKTLTFYRDNNRDDRTGTVYSLNKSTNEPGWLAHKATITSVVFDQSFANATPTSCYRWFYQMSNLTGFTGMENLNTSKTTVFGSMFNSCKSLTSIDLSSFSTISATSLATMFASCSKLASIDLSKFDTRNVTNMRYMFSNCSALTSIDLDRFDMSKVTDMNHMFNNCSSLTSLDISMVNVNSSLNTSNMMLNCTALHTLKVPETANDLDDTACKGIGTQSSPCTLVCPEGFNPDKTATGDGWYKWKNGFFCDESMLIDFADATTKGLCVGKWDTNGDGELSMAEAAAVTTLGTTFKKSQITSFNELQHFKGLTNISDGAFNGSTINEITLPANITSIGKDAFLDCKSLTGIGIPSKVQAIGQNALSGCTTMTDITVDEGNASFCSIDGVLFSKDKTELLQFPAAKATAYTVPEGTKVIGRDAFYMSKLKTVTLPSSLEELGFDAFGYSKSLTELAIPEGVTIIGEYILDGCSGLKTLHIPSTVTTISDHMCNSCNAITNVYSGIRNPFAISKDNFTTKAYSNATLHVPSTSADTYKETEGWKYFNNITGDMISNILLADNMEICTGGNSELTISLYNDSKIDGAQFDLVLPEGLTIATGANGSFEIETTNRSNRLTANCTKQADGKYRFLLFSIDRSVIEPGEGEILKIKVACPTDAAPGNYEMAFSGISLSCVNGSVSVNHDCDDFTANVTIKEVSTMPGDANGDYEVDITDVMMMVTLILEGDVPGFIFANADLDNNEVVNITDVMNVVAIILGGDMSNAPANARTATHDLLRVSPEATGCLLHTTAAAQGITALQMNVTLPDGCRLNKATLTGEAARTHKVMTKQMDDGSYNVVMFSMTGNTLPTDAPILNLDIEGRDGMVSMEGILCTNVDLETILSSDISSVLTGIANIQTGGDKDGNTPIYNTSGQRLSKTQRGVNISNGKKVLVK